VTHFVGAGRQVEGVSLREFPLAGEAQADEQKAGDEDRPGHLFHDRQRR
jgi:hypothetical protein